MSLSTVKPFITGSGGRYVQQRYMHYKFKRTRLPPLPEPKESPYIVGPYLKPNYMPVKYTTEPIRQRFDDDLKHFIYELTEVPSDEGRTIKLILTGDVEGLGVAGQVVDAPYRAARLIAMKKAEYATDFASKWYKFGPKTTQSASSALSPRTIRFLRRQTFPLPIVRSVTLEPWHICLALRLSGCICPIDAVDASSIGTFVTEEGNVLAKCTILINNHEKVEVRFSFKDATENNTDYMGDLS